MVRYVYIRRMIVFFFFSSRRRHTRLQGDWSSDVCSSDLYQNCSIPLPFGNTVYEVFPIDSNLTITANGNGIWWQNSKTGGPLFFPPFGTSVANVDKEEGHPVKNLFPLDLALGTGEVYQINPTLQGYYPIYRGNVF